MYEGLFDGITNMRRDADLLAQAESGVTVWRVYGWDGPWVSLGRFQKADTALKPDAPVQWVERPTGGRGVLHGHDVTLGLAFPLAVLCPQDEWRSIRAVYRATIAPIVEALRLCGADAALGEALDRSPDLKSPDCFALISANDVVDLANGEKICGCALRLTETAVLAQCSIPAAEPLVDPANVYVGAAPAHWIDLEHAAFASALKDVMNKKARR